MITPDKLKSEYFLQVKCSCFSSWRKYTFFLGGGGGNDSATKKTFYIEWKNPTLKEDLKHLPADLSISL